jgi:arylsulfatase A-like enzyme
VAGPGVPAGHTVDAMASTIDLAPTFLDIAHAEPTAEQDGVSLLDLWHGAAAPPDWQRAVLIEHHGPAQVRHDPDAQPLSSGNPPSYEAVRATSSLYVEYETGEREYYDLASDPNELHNVYASLTAERQARLHAMLSSLANCHGSAECQRAAAPAGL